LRLETVFTRPDNEYLDLYVLRDEPVLTDMADILMWYRIQGIDLDASKVMKRRVESALAFFSCYRDGGAIKYRLKDEATVPFAVCELVQCLLRLSSFIYLCRP
jgi:hypothetical protein